MSIIEKSDQALIALLTGKPRFGYVEGPFCAETMCDHQSCWDRACGRPMPIHCGILACTNEIAADSESPFCTECRTVINGH